MQLDRASDGKSGPSESAADCLIIGAAIGPDGESFSIAGWNQCPVKIPDHVVDVRFYNDDDRVGIERVTIVELEPNEHFSHKYKIAADIYKPQSVKVHP